TTATAMIPMITAYSANVWPRSSRALDSQRHARTITLLAYAMSEPSFQPRLGLDVGGGLRDRADDGGAQRGDGTHDCHGDDPDDDRVLGEGLTLLLAGQGVPSRHP